MCNRIMHASKALLCIPSEVTIVKWIFMKLVHGIFIQKGLIMTDQRLDCRILVPGQEKHRTQNNLVFSF